MNTPTAFKTIFGPKGNVVKTESYFRAWPHDSRMFNTWNTTNIEQNYVTSLGFQPLCFGKNFNMKEPESDLKHVPELMATYLQILQPVSTANMSLENTEMMQTNVKRT